MTTMNRTSVVAEPNTQNIVMTRVINAPRDRVYQAHVDREIYPKWLGPDGETVELEELDVTRGGRYRYAMTGPDGTSYGFRGVYHDVRENEQIVQTFEFEGMPGHICLETIEFTDADGGTLITSNAVYQSVEDRDGMIQSGMEQGASEGYDRLEKILSVG